MHTCFKNLKLCNVRIQSKEKQAFVLVPFESDFRAVYDSLKQIFESRDWSCLRADEKIDIPESICRICKNIQESEMIVADVTEKNPNVFLELGLSFGFGKEVVIITQDLHDLPFDVKTFHAFEYSLKNISKLTTELSNHLQDRTSTTSILEEESELKDLIYGPIFEEMSQILKRIQLGDNMDYEKLQKIVDDYLFVRVSKNLQDRILEIKNKIEIYQNIRFPIELEIRDIARKRAEELFNVDIGHEFDCGSIRVLVGKSMVSAITLRQCILRETKPEDFVKNETKKYGESVAVEASIGGRQYETGDFARFYTLVLKEIEKDSNFFKERDLRKKLIEEISELLSQIRNIIEK